MVVENGEFDSENPVGFLDFSAADAREIRWVRLVLRDVLLGRRVIGERDHRATGAVDEVLRDVEIGA